MKFAKRAMVDSKERRESQKEFWDEFARLPPEPRLLGRDSRQEIDFLGSGVRSWTISAARSGQECCKETQCG